MGDRPVLIDIGGVLLVDDLSEVVAAWTPRLRRSEKDFLAALFGGSDKGVLVGQVDEAQWWDVVGSRLGLGAATLVELVCDLLAVGEWSDLQIWMSSGPRRGATRTAAVANAWPAWPYLRARLRKGGIAELFDEVVLSCEVGCAKPDPRIYQVILERLGVAPGDVLFVDDVSDNVEAAESLGMPAHLHRNTADTAERIGSQTVDSPDSPRLEAGINRCRSYHPEHLLGAANRGVEALGNGDGSAADLHTPISP